MQQVESELCWLAHALWLKLCLCIVNLSGYIRAF